MRARSRVGRRLTRPRLWQRVTAWLCDSCTSTCLSRGVVGLTTAEEELQAAATKGEVANFGGHRVAIGAEFLAELLSGRHPSKVALHPRGLRIRGARIEGPIDWTGQKFLTSVSFTDCEFVGPLLGNRLSVAGDFSLNRSQLDAIELADSRIDGNLGLEDVVVKLTSWTREGQAGSAVVLDLNSIVVDGTLTLKGAQIPGEVSLLYAKISGQLLCQNATIGSGQGDAFSADGARIKQDACFDAGFHAKGTLRLFGTRIGGQLICNGAQLSGANGLALCANDVVVGEDVFLQNSPDGKSFVADGEVSFGCADLHGSLLCKGATFRNSGGTTFDGGGMKVANRLVFAGLAVRPDGSVKLTKAYVGLLEDDESSWPSDSGSMEISGFVYDQFGPAASDVGVEKRLDWIRLQKTYSPQPYLQLAKVYKQSGRDDELRHVLVARQTDLRTRGRLNPTQKGWNAFFGFALAHGYRPLRGVLWILLLYGVSVALVWQAQAANAFVAVGPTATVHHAMAADCTSAYPCLSPFVYPVDAAVPVLNLHEADYWKFDENTFWGQVGRDWLDAATLLGWVLTTLIVVGLTRTVRET